MMNAMNISPPFQKLFSRIKKGYKQDPLDIACLLEDYVDMLRGHIDKENFFIISHC